MPAGQDRRVLERFLVVVGIRATIGYFRGKEITGWKPWACVGAAGRLADFGLALTVRRTTVGNFRLAQNPSQCSDGETGRLCFWVSARITG